jgi:N-acetylmuramoyl-L-alanine amidase
MRPILIAAVLAALPVVAAAAEPASEAQCLAEAVYFEARGKGPEAGAAVAHVVLNRTESEEFPDTACDVVADGCQFSYMCDGKPEAMAEARERDAALRTARRVLEGRVDDPTDGALFFHSDGIDPGWTGSRDRTGRIGGNVFYRCERCRPH